jgi:hypothetical protein
MQVVPLSVGRTSRSWDEQHLDVLSAARLIGTAPTSGFTGAVTGTAARFAATWQRHTRDLAGDAESLADGLRSTLADYLRTDQAVGVEQLALLSLLREIR